MSSRAMPSSLAAAKHASARKRASELSPAGVPSIGLTAFSLTHSSTKLAARLLMEGPLGRHSACHGSEVGHGRSLCLATVCAAAGSARNRYLRVRSPHPPAGKAANDFAAEPVSGATV